MATELALGALELGGTGRVVDLQNLIGEVMV